VTDEMEALFALQAQLKCPRLSPAINAGAGRGPLRLIGEVEPRTMSEGNASRRETIASAGVDVVSDRV
jgi:hypothetical protein